MNSLGHILRATKDGTKASLGELTVLSPQNDPFRLDTPANHAKGRWFRECMEACGLFGSPAAIHNRGIHYAVVSLGSATLPGGAAYINNADCWAFLEEASNTARWLGYVPWSKIFDARNADPVIYQYEHPARPEVFPYFGGASIVDDLASTAGSLLNKPTIEWSDFNGRQPYHLVFYGEKTSLGGVLQPLARQYGADLYLPSGEISNTLLASMARQGEQDGREMIVLIFADCDPAGYQMSVSIGHKLRALAEGLHPSLSFRVFAPCLTVEQVKELGLPSTPLKETELRAAGWRERYGVEQTEIDALATLRPDALRQIVCDAIEPFYDATLQDRSDAAMRRSVAAAQAEFDRLLAGSDVPQLQTRAASEMAALRETLEQIRVAVDAVDVTVRMEAVVAALPCEVPASLVDSAMPLVEHIRTLKGRKDYSGGAS